MNNVESLEPDKEHLKQVMNMWGDSLMEYGLCIELDTESKVSKALESENRSRIRTAEFCFKLALEKYQKTNDSAQILKYLIHLYELRVVNLRIV
jgi:hypothetical protein